MIGIQGHNGTMKVYTVDTALKNGNSSATSGQEVNGYNVPIVSADLVAYDTYTVTIYHVKSGSDTTRTGVNIDGFRVHGTLDMNSEVYQQDNEANPTFAEMRNAVLAGLNVDTKNGQYAQQIAKNAMSQVYASSETGNGAVVLYNNYSAADSNYDVQDLLDNGPKNEFYLFPGQTVVFKITDGYDNVQVGLKALNQATNYTINGESKTLDTSTDMFYPVTLGSDRVVTIENKGAEILSITEIKAIPSASTASEANVFAALTANDLMLALLSMGFESEPVAATATLNITVQCGDKAVPVTLTYDGMSNETHTFTAAEIKAAVEQALPKGYTVADVTFSDVTVACGETSDVSFAAAEVPAPAGLLHKIIQVGVKIVKKIISWF